MTETLDYENETNARLQSTIHEHVTQRSSAFQVTWIEIYRKDSRNFWERFANTSQRQVEDMFNRDVGRKLSPAYEEENKARKTKK